MIYNTLNYKDREQRPYKVSGPSCTVPDQTMSVEEIVKRHQAGQVIMGALDPLYDELAEGINIKTKDLVEIAQIREQVKEDIARLQARAQQEADEMKKKREDAKKKYEDMLIDRLITEAEQKKGAANSAH